VLDFNDLQIKDYSPEQKIFFHINCRAPVEQDDCPVFRKFLSEVLVMPNTTETDKDLVDLVQYMFGYYFVPEIKPPTVFFLLGNGSNGKSTIQFVMKQLVGGSEFAMEDTIESLTTGRFEKEQLRYKRLNICGEEQSKYIKTDSFKRLIEGGIIETDIKFKSRVQFHSITKHIFSSNNLPSFGNIDYALQRRIKIIPLHRRFDINGEANFKLNTEDSGFEYSDFYPEFPGIVKFAIDGARKFRQSGYTFPVPAQLNETFKTYEEEVDTAISFFRCNFELSEDGFFLSSFVYEIYQSWCEGVGRKKQSKVNFQKSINRNIHLFAVPGWDKIKQRDGSGYKIKLKDTSEVGALNRDHDDVLTQLFTPIEHEEHKIPNFE
jgi:putative DNA primase/helicase